MNNNSDNQTNKSLYDVFSELQDIQHSQIQANPKYQKKINKLNKFKNNNQINTQNDILYNEGINNIPLFNETLNYENNYYNTNYDKTLVYPCDLNLAHIIIGFTLLLFGIIAFFPTSNVFISSYALEETSSTSMKYELNRHSINIQDIVNSNSGITIIKEQLIEERDVDFPVTYNNISSLPKGEEIVTQEGVLGKDIFGVVQTFEDGNFIEEVVFNRETLIEPIPKIIDIGTSEFLAKHSIHLNDTIYLTSNCTLKNEPNSTSSDVAEIKEFLDVKLLELPNEDWCKISFDNIEGYLNTSNITSANSDPSIVEKNRVQKLLTKVNPDIALNKPSGLTLNDYEKIFSNLPKDENNIFKNNYQAFYNAEKKYNINGLALASIAIHESSWGTSQIALDKNNLFGYGSYDTTPYESSFDFDTYEAGIETVAKSLVKYYINPQGIIIYDGEVAEATYYNGPTLSAVNERYASDKDWHTKIFDHIKSLYDLLK